MAIVNRHMKSETNQSIVKNQAASRLDGSVRIIIIIITIKKPIVYHPYSTAITLLRSQMISCVWVVAFLYSTVILRPSDDQSSINKITNQWYYIYGARGWTVSFRRTGQRLHSAIEIIWRTLKRWRRLIGSRLPSPIDPLMSIDARP